MKKAGILILVLIIAVLSGRAVYHYNTIPKEEGVCKLKTVSSVPYLYGYDIVHFFWAMDREPESLSGTPENVKGQKIFFSIPFKGRNLKACLLDHGQKRYTIYADLNDNDNLADEKPIVSRKKTYGKDDYIYLFGPMSLQAETENVTTAPFYLFLTNFTRGIHIAPTTIQKGKIKINDAIHEVMLADLDFDGEYKTYFSPECLVPGILWTEGLWDKLLFDLDHDGKFINCSFILMEHTPLPKLIHIDKQYYSIQITENELLASPVTPESGTLKLNTHQSSMLLYSDTYSSFIDAANTKNLPVGFYSVMYSQNHFKEANDDIWTCRSKRQSGSAADFEISANSETTIEFPTSFLLKTAITYKDGKCGINIMLYSEDNKEYTPLFQKNDHTVKEPVITIYDQQNVIVHTGTMEYG